MDRLRIMAVDCKCNETDRHLKDQFINDFNNNGMVIEIIRELAAINDRSSVISEQALAWV